MTISLPSGTSAQYVELSFTANTGWSRGAALGVRDLPRHRRRRDHPARHRALSASPTSVSFGSQAVGSTSAAQTVTVSNPGTAAATVSSVSGGRPVRRDQHLRDLDRRGRLVHGERDLHAHRGGRGLRRACRWPATPPRPLTVALSGTGTSPATAACRPRRPRSRSPARRSGPPARRRPSRSPTPGPQRPRCRRSASPGPFSQTNTCGTSLAAGGTCTVSVNFAPTAAGAATGTLSVNSSAPGSPLTVALSGTGTSRRHRGAVGLADLGVVRQPGGRVHQRGAERHDHQHRHRRGHDVVDRRDRRRSARPTTAAPRSRPAPPAPSASSSPRPRPGRRPGRCRSTAAPPAAR